MFDSKLVSHLVLLDSHLDVGPVRLVSGGGVLDSSLFQNPNFVLVDFAPCFRPVLLILTRHLAVYQISFIDS